MFGHIVFSFLSCLGGWDAIKVTLKVRFICSFVVIDPTNLGAITEFLSQGLCLSIFNLSPTQNTCLFFDGNKASLCVEPLWRVCLFF